MAQRKKKSGWRQFTNFEDFMDAMREQQEMREDGENDTGLTSDGGSQGGEATKLSDFIIEEKVQAFVQGYQPCDEFDDGAVGFDDADLRTLLKAYVCPLGDPLKLYIEHLKLAGFRMTVSVATGQLTMFATRRFEY